MANLAVLTKPDIVAIIAYLKSLPPVKNKVPGPFRLLEVPTSFIMRLVPPGSSSTVIDVGGTLAGR